MNSDAKHKAETGKEALKTILLISLWFWVWIRSNQTMFSTFSSKSDYMQVYYFYPLEFYIDSAFS